MNNLGIIILKNGKTIKFGDFLCGMYRDCSNPKHFHNESFREKVKENKSDFQFISDIDNFDLTKDLKFVAQNDCVVILNATSGSFEPGIPTLLVVSPSELSNKQKKSMINAEKTFNYFDGGIIYIDVVDSTGDVVRDYISIDEYFKDIVKYNYVSTFDYESFIASKQSM